MPRSTLAMSKSVKTKKTSTTSASASTSTSTNSTSASTCTAGQSSSVVEKLNLLRSFVGNASFTETDLSTCLRQAHYNIELAAERLMTGQYQPLSKKQRSTSPVPVALSSIQVHNTRQVAPPSTGTGTPQSHSSTATRIRNPTNPTPVTPKTPSPSMAHGGIKSRDLSTTTPSALSTSSSSVSASSSQNRSSPSSTAVVIPSTTPTTSASSIHDDVDDSNNNNNNNDNDDWLLCHRWISDGVCLQRNGCLRYKEVLHVEYSSSMVRFRGSQIQGQFPKPLSRFLAPLLEANLIRVRAQALMEERFLPMGAARVAFAVWIYLKKPAAFFQVFQNHQQQQQQQQNSASSSNKLFFGKPNPKSKHGKATALCEAAFGLLQWAHYGEPYEFQSDASKTNDSDELSNDDDNDDDATLWNDTDASLPINEEDVPEWARLATSQDPTKLSEMEPPIAFKVSLRRYQQEALWWMTQREAQEELEESSRQQLQLLQELAQQQTTTSTTTTSTTSTRAQTTTSSLLVSAKRPIHCECGPVHVNIESLEAPPVTSNGSNPDLQHPLWERRYLTNRDQSQALSFYVQPLFGTAMAAPPPPPRPCRGGILADSMGLGKTVMLLALIQSTKGSGPTLIVAPLSLLAQWEEELTSKTTLSYKVHYGDKKQQGLHDVSSVDVVVTTYGSIQAEWLAHSKLQQQQSALMRGSTLSSRGGLLGQSWKRVILDEAHCIKNNSTVAAKACSQLNAERRWCVSGTIIQNSLDDVYSLVKFLHHEPWCQSSFWKAAITKAAEPTMALDRVRKLLAPIMLRRTKETIGSDGKPILTLPPVETKIISVEFTPAERQFYDALLRKSLSLFEGFIRAGTASKSWLAIFSLLHRLRQTCDHVALTVKAHINEDEWTSSIIQSNNNNKVNTKEKALVSPKDDSIDQEFLGDLMSKFRCMQSSSSLPGKNSNASTTEDGDAPYLAKIANLLNDAVKSKSSLLQEECSICLDQIKVHDSVVTPCFHIFCKECLVDVLQQTGSKTTLSTRKGGAAQKLPSGPCPVCTEEINPSKILQLSEKDGDIETSYLSSSVKCLPASPKEEDGEARQTLEGAVQGSSSSKLTAILEELNAVWEEEPGSKVLVFSQFLGFLDLMEESFKSNEIPFSRLDGKLSLKERMSVLQAFGAESKAPTVGKSTTKTGSVLLISMKAGGVGLNLVAARTVFIADPWWNAAVEDQCVDRIHRIGQTADKVRVRKFYVANSVEERIVELQKRKKNVASEVLCDRSSMPSEAEGNNSRPTLEDFKILFQGN